MYVSGKTFYNDWLVNDFTLNELKMLNRRQAHMNRSPYMNGVFTMQTLEEVIDHMKMLKADIPRSIGAGVEAGLYIEIKDYEFYVQNRTLD